MDINQLDLKLNKYFEDVLSSRKSSLQETKEIALKLWDFICMQSSHCKNIDICHYNNGEISLISNSQKIEYSNGEYPNFCDDSELLTLISIIAENSEINGKFNSICTSSYRELKFRFK